MADSDDPNLNVRVTAESDVSGIREAEEGVSGLKGTLGETATELRHLTGSSREGQEIFRGLGAAARGGAAGVGEMIRGLRSLALIATHIMGEGPLGILLIGLGLIGGAFLAMRGHSEEAGKSLKETGDRAEELKKSVDSLAKSFEEDFKRMEKGAKDLYDQLERLDKLQKESNAAADKMDKAKAGVIAAQLDLDEQNSLAAAQTPEDREHIRDVFSHRRKLAKLNEEAGESEQSVRDAYTEAHRSEEARTAAGNRQAEAEADLRAKQAAADNATGAATRFGAELLEFAKTGEHPITEADQTKRRSLADAAFAARGALAKSQGTYDSIGTELSKTISKADSDASRFQQATDLNEQVQKKVEIERETLTQIEAGKANDEAAKQARNLAEAAKKAAEELGKIGKEKGDKPEHETRAEKEEADAEENHRTLNAEKHAERMAGSAKKAASAVEEHAKSVVDSHNRIVHTLAHTSKESERTSRQLANMRSDTSP